MNIFKKALSAVLAVCMVMSLSIASLAAERTNIADYSVKVNGTEVTKLFEGELFDLTLELEDFESFTVYDLAYRYDSENIQLIDNEDAVLTAEDKSFYSDSVGGSDDPTFDFAFGNYGLTVKGDFEWSSIFFFAVSPIDGALHFAQMTDNIGGDIADKTEMFTLRFKALKKTNAGEKVIRYADIAQDNDLFIAISDDGTGLEVVPDGSVFSFSGAELPLTNNEIPAIEIYEKPTLTGIAWGEEGSADEYTVSWATPVEGCRGYELTIEKDGVQIGEVIELDNTVTSYPMFETIKDTKNGGDVENYKVSLKALGGVGSDVVSASKDVAGIPLSIPGNVKLTDGVLTWDAVVNADKYVVTIKDGNGNLVVIEDEHGNVIPNPFETTGREADINKFFSVGDYDITVTAKSDIPMYIPATSDKIEYNTGSLVKGKIAYNAPQPETLIYNKDVAAVVYLKSENANYSTKVLKDGTFEIAGVVAGEYEVSITRFAGIDRTIGKKLTVGAASVVMDITEGTAIQIFLGDINGSALVDTSDLSGIIAVLGATENASGFNAAADFTVPSTGENNTPIIQLSDMTVVVKNYGNLARKYIDDTDISF